MAVTPGDVDDRSQRAARRGIAAGHSSPHPCGTYGAARPGKMLASMAVGRRSLIRMTALVQVQPGPRQRGLTCGNAHPLMAVDLDCSCESPGHSGLRAHPSRPSQDDSWLSRDLDAAGLSPWLGEAECCPGHSGQHTEEHCAIADDEEQLPQVRGSPRWLALPQIRRSAGWGEELQRDAIRIAEAHTRAVARSLISLCSTPSSSSRRAQLSSSARSAQPEATWSRATRNSLNRSSGAGSARWCNPTRVLPSRYTV